jgi:hypothetical protein
MELFIENKGPYFALLPLQVGMGADCFLHLALPWLITTESLTNHAFSVTAA